MMIQFVQIDVGKKLAGEVSDRETTVFSAVKQGFVDREFLSETGVSLEDVIFRRVVKNDDVSQKDQFVVCGFGQSALFDMTADKLKENGFVDAHKKALDIAFEKIAVSHGACR
jgi:hypothetical protein